MNRWKLPLGLMVGTAAFLAIVFGLINGFLVRKSSATAALAATGAPAEGVGFHAPSGSRASPNISVSSVPVARPNAPSPVAARIFPTRAEQNASVEQARLDYLGRFEGEATDASWAAAKETRVSGKFGQLKEKYHLTAKVVDVVCRSTLCVMKLTWSDWRSANDERRKFASELSADEGCGHFMSVPPPADGTSGEYSGDLILDCKTQRTGETPGFQ
jgi:hypothetical protein